MARGVEYAMGLSAMTWYRVARRARQLGLRPVCELLQKVTYLLHSSYVPCDAEIGEGTEFGYGGIGVVIHPESRIGRHCLISQQVTLGGRSGRKGAPQLEDFVRVGAGAKILGPVQVGRFAVIGANAVVLADVAAGAVVAGVPARELRRDPNPSEAYTREMGRSPGEYGH